MPSSNVLRLILNSTLLLVCSSALAASTKSNVKPVPPTSKLNLQASYALAALPDDEDCEPDVLSQIINYPKKYQESADTQKIQLAMLNKPGSTRTDTSGSGLLALNITKETNAANITNGAKEIKTITDEKNSPALINNLSAAIDQSWEIALADKTINAVLARWAVKAGWQLVWELPIDYTVDAQTNISGSFEQAVEMVAKSMETAEIPLKAVFYSGNKVLRIVQLGSQ